MGHRVGVFDSGVGGLSVWAAVVQRLPGVETIYVADQAHIPYGARPVGQIRAYARGITRFLRARGCETVVVACNTASAAALQALREEFPQMRFVGMEPAVKPAALLSQTKVVAVLATPATLDGELLSNTSKRHAESVRLVRQPCPGLVECIEAGVLNGQQLEKLLRDCLRSSLEAGADTIVLACTHYPFVRDRIESIVGPNVRVVDPATAVARQVARVLDSGGDPAHVSGRSGAPPRHCFVTTGRSAEFERVAALLLQAQLDASTIRWIDDAELPA